MAGEGGRVRKGLGAGAAPLVLVGPAAVELLGILRDEVGGRAAAGGRGVDVVAGRDAMPEVLAQGAWGGEPRPHSYVSAVAVFSQERDLPPWLCGVAVPDAAGALAARRDGLDGCFIDCGGVADRDGPHHSGFLFDEHLYWDPRGEVDASRLRETFGPRLAALAEQAWGGLAPVRGPVRFLTPRFGMARWAGKVAVVTGASAGIGKCVATALALQGMHVVACARRLERLKDLAREVETLGAAGSIVPLELDVSDLAAAADLRGRIAKARPGGAGGDFEVLINNAGLGRDDASLMEGSIDAWTQMLNTNVLAVAVLSREAVASVRSTGHEGHIINISSLSGHRVPNRRPPLGFYAATKHAVRALTEGLRQELAGAKVPCRVSAISPGLVRTEFYEAFHGGDAEKGEKTYEGLGFESLAADDVTETVLQHLGAPRRALVADTLLRPAGQGD